MAPCLLYHSRLNYLAHRNKKDGDAYVQDYLQMKNSSQSGHTEHIQVTQQLQKEQPNKVFAAF